MTGLIYAATPLVAACLVARREPAHRPVALALGASALYSVAALPAVASHLDARALLGLFALVAVASAHAYARAFGWRWRLEDVTFGIGMAGLAVAGASGPIVQWQLMTWGPFVVSSVVGALAAWAWWVDAPHRQMIARAIMADRQPTDADVIAWWQARATWRASFGIAQRCALVLLASDVCMLAFVRWPGVQAWQGRAAALAVTVVQVVWLIKERKRQ